MENEFRLSNSAIGCLEKIKKLADEITMTRDDFTLLFGENWEASIRELAQNGLIRRENIDNSENDIKISLIFSAREKRNKYQKNLMRKRRKNARQNCDK